MRFDVTATPEQAARWAAATDAGLARAATAAVTEAGNVALRDGRADIAGSGLGRKHQSALRLDVFPKGQDSLNAAAVIRSKIPYEGIFEDGGIIVGSPLLWLPIEKNLPTRSGGRRWTPSKYAAAFGPLVSLRRSGNQPPLLGGRRGKRVVPLFVGIGTASDRKRLHIRELVARAASRLDEFLHKALDRI